MGSPSNGGLTREPAAQQASVRSAAEIYLESLGAHGVDYLFANAGTDFPPIVEGLARGEERGARMPRALVVPHENIAVGMAHGYYRHRAAAGRDGARQRRHGERLNCIINAARDHVPLLLRPGAHPTPRQARSARAAARSTGRRRCSTRPAWCGNRQMGIRVALSGPSRRVVAPRPGSGHGASARPRVPDAAARTAAAPVQTIARGRAQPPAAPHPDPAAVAPRRLDRAGRAPADCRRSSAAMLRPSRRSPASRALRHPGVAQTAPRSCACRPATRCTSATAPTPLLAEADLVIVLDCDVPWIPSQQSPPAGCRVAHIGVDPGFARYPMRSFPSDLSIAADPAPRCRAPGRGALRREARRGAACAPRRGARRPAQEMGVRDQGRLADVVRVRQPLHRRGEGRRCRRLQRVPAAARAVPVRAAGKLLPQQPCGRPRLGTGRGARRKARAARPNGDRHARRWRVYLRQPDRGALGVHGLRAADPGGDLQQRAVGRGTPRDQRDVQGRRVGAAGLARAANLSPAPAYEKLVEAHGGHGEPSSAPKICQALARALAATRKGKQALLNVLCE